MDKKRRSDVPAESEPPEKRKAPEFNGTEFKTMLRNPTTAMRGLQQFIFTAKKLPCSDMYDVVEGYIKISMECSEIFSLLEGEKHTETEMMLVFESLEVILLRTASDLSHFNMVGIAIVKKMVSGHMKLLQGSFQTTNHGFVRQCLNLLSAMVSQGVEAAREVLNHIQIKAFPKLATRRDKRGKPDVRLAFIQFVLSFLVSGNNAIIGQILDFKEFLPHILNTGLKEDRMSTVNLILSTLKSRVVFNKAISKTQKVRFFTPAVLDNLASLYKWNGIADASIDDDTTAEDSDSSGISVVRELVHSFFLDLCCSYKHGISFNDASFGTSGRAGNLVLLQFLVGLKQATEDDLVADLVVNVLKTCPDILSRYFKETQYSYTPRLRSAWQDNVKLLKKIYEAQPEISTVFQSGEMIPLPRLLSMIMVISVPPVCNRVFFTQGLNLSNSTVQLTTVSIMNFILKKANKSMAYLLDKSVWHKSDVYTDSMMEELVQQYREALGKILPDMTSIISSWQSLSKKKNPGGEDEKTKSEECVEQANNENELPVADAAEVILLKALILQVICLYQKVVPHLVMQSKFDFSKLLKGIVSEKGMRQEIPPILQYQILQLALDLPASKFSWCRIQDVACSESSSGEKSVLYLLLKMFVSSTNSSSFLRSSTQKLILKVLKDTGVFEYTLSEVELWLEQLARLEPNQQETVIPFLERILIKLVGSSHEYTDKVANFVQEASQLQANLSNQEGDAVSIPISHIDDVLDMVDVIMEGNDGEMEEFGPSLSEDLIVQTFPFSALVPAALEARNNLPADKGVVCEYLSAVLLDVLHSQREPLPLCLSLLQYDKELASSQLPASVHQSIIHFHQYYSMWLPQESHEQLFKSSECLTKELSAPSSCSSLLKAAYIQGPGALLEDAFRQNIEKTLASMPMSEFSLVTKQILLYVKSTVENFGKFSKDIRGALLGILMGMLQELVTKLQSFVETSDSEPAAETQKESDLFLEVNQSPTVEASKEQVLVSVLASIFKHPCLEQWFLALELAAFPPHSLKPVALKHLCAQMTDNTLTLLKISAPALYDLSHLELLCSYMGALEKATLKELQEKCSRPPKTHSRTLQALLFLHNYMDSRVLREVVSRLLLLPHDSLISPSSEGTQPELSVYGQVALQILTKCTSTSYQDHGRFLTQAHLHGLGTLLVSCSSPELEALLLQTLSSNPGSAKLIHTDVLLHCLQKPVQNTLAISALLLENCSSHRLRFEVWCLESTNMEKMLNTKAFLPLVNTYLQVASKEDPARPKDVQKDVLKALKQTLLPKLSWSILENQGEDSGVQLVETATSLIKLSADRNDIEDLITNLPDSLQNIDNYERWQLVDLISEKLADCPVEQEKWRKSVMTSALKCLMASYCHIKDHAASPSTQEQSILKRLQQLMTSPENVAASDWNSFVKNGLRNRYGDHHFLNTLSNLLELMYGSSEIQKDLISLSTLHMMTSSHSQFLPTLLDSREEPNKSQAKEALISLLYCLVKKCPTVCNTNHFVVLLAAYRATLSASDQKLLLLLQEYEKNQVSLLKFQSFLWGPAAVEHHKTRKSLGASLWKQPSSNDVLALLNTDMMSQTILKFPQQRTIFPQDSTELLYSSDAVEDLGSLYDPCFLLPLFSAILRPECVIDCLKFASSHALGVTLMALSSYDPNIRAAAYHVLTCFYHHLEAARFREKRQLLYLMTVVKNGIRRQNQRVPFVLASYINKVAQLMLRPEDHMYVVLNRFLLGHQDLDLMRIPNFYNLFCGFELEYKIEQEWILNVLEEGINDGRSFEICNQQGVFKVLLGFISSPLCSEYFQTQIIRVLCHAARVTKAAYGLIRNCGLLSWMLQVVEKRNLNQQLLCSLIDLLHGLWFTVLGQKEKKVNEVTSSTDESFQSLMKCVPLPFISEFLCVSLAINRHLRLGVKATHLSLFARTLCSLLTHRATALCLNKQADRLTLRPQPLSCTETLSLLLSWASLSQCTALLTKIQALSEKHKLKELTGWGRFKVRGKSHVYQGSRRDVNSPEDSKTLEGSLLTDCKVHLSRIFVHWEPVSHLSEPQADQSGDKLDPSELAGDTALLLTEWSLRWLVENPSDESATREFLHWFKKAVMKHKKIKNAVMLDFDLKADLLQLFHLTVETRCHSSFETRVETLQLFTNIMIGLLEMQGHPSDLHQSVLSACLSHQDQSRCEAGLFLLSMYIHELWSGAASAELFLSHVRLVTGVKSKNKKVSTSSKTQPAIRAICNDIIAMKR
ncbi:nucleolar pre-ribosomal-associated protein 1 [Austrofundulus limnaeus]|uniref:Nucleolar pre-ribosomal-associated protein 1 n=1 Tax=Austrofundulus limnaeus TaxID=52670 RepID=A0A2I4BKB9_AUSLI|nr:PREDICTED: nucleolar pre-ribosomal-associated protein 1 [Austrofundulus limnaeus]